METKIKYTLEIYCNDLIDNCILEKKQDIAKLNEILKVNTKLKKEYKYPLMFGTLIKHVAEIKAHYSKKIYELKIKDSKKSFMYEKQEELIENIQMYIDLSISEISVLESKKSLFNDEIKEEIKTLIKKIKNIVP